MELLQFLMRYLSLFPIIILSSVIADNVIYYGDSHVCIEDPFEITCIIPISEPVQWSLNGKVVSKYNFRQEKHSFVESELNIHDNVIYYGDSHVCIEDPFEITCIIPISEPVQWSLNGKVVSKYNFRQEKHSFVESELNIHGKADKIESKLSVKSALKLHEGNYKCNFLHPNYHLLNVIDKSSFKDNQTQFTNDSNTPLIISYIENEWETNINVSSNVHSSEEFIAKGKQFKIQDNIPEQNLPFINSSLGKISQEINTTKLPPTKARIQANDILVPNYGNVDKKLIAFKIRHPLMLSCNITKEGDFELKWEKNGTDVNQIEDLKGRFKILKAERKFMMDRAEERDAGTYSCILDTKEIQERKDINVVATLVAKVPSSTGVVEGEKLSIHCQVLGTDPEISWAIGNQTIKNTTDRWILKEDEKYQNAILIIENASLEDRGDYKCIAKNLASETHLGPEAIVVSYVRIKGKLAALWPFLGICAEVIVLCTIILVYEKRRNKAELDESDTDPNTEQ